MKFQGKIHDLSHKRLAEHLSGSESVGHAHTAHAAQSADRIMPLRGSGIRLSTAVGAAVLLISVATLLGRVPQTEALVWPIGGQGMVFVTALCFAPLAVILDNPQSLHKTRIQQGLGSMV